MFEQPTSGLNVRALIRDMIDEEHELLTALGQDFLSEHLTKVESKLKRWERYLANHYSDDAVPPRGDAGKLPTYQIELALIQRLATESQTESFPVVHQRALKQASQHMQHLLTQRDFTNPALRMVRFEAHLEQELLVELWSKWHTWLKPRGLRNTTARSL